MYLELERTGREIVEIGLDQMHRYLGNLLEAEGLGRTTASFSSVMPPT